MMPGLRDWVFSAKTFASAMLALYIALLMGLDRPYWALMTVYIVAQPLTGAMRSKSVYRFAGTLLGAAAAITLVPNLVAAPFLLTAALALWIGVCVYFALLDRTPRSYVFLLAGFTAAIIGFPCVDAPETIFAVAIARIEETHAGDRLHHDHRHRRAAPPARPRAAVAHRRLVRPCAQPVPGRAVRPPGRRRRGIAARRSLAADAVEIRMLTTHLAFDTSNLQAATRPIEAARAPHPLPVPGAERARRSAGHAARVRRRSRRYAGAGGPARRLDHGRRCRARGGGRATGMPRSATPHRRSAATPAGMRSCWPRCWRVCSTSPTSCTTRARCANRSPPAAADLPPLALPRGIAPDATRFRDHGMALLSAFSAAMATVLVSAFWIGAAWPAGGTAAMMAAVGCSFFAAQDDPAPAILQFLQFVMIGLAIDAVYLFVVLPKVVSFAQLALVFAPTFLVLGVMIAVPATNFAGMAIAVNAAGMLALADVYNADFTAFVNNALATAVGMATAASLTRIVRSVGAEWSARRLLRANRRDIARVAAHQGALDQATLTALILDRLCELVPRLAATGAHADQAAAAALVDLRTGLNVVHLQRDRVALPSEADIVVARTLDGIAGHFRDRAPLPAHDALRADIDRAIVAVIGVAGPRTRNLLLELVGIRHNLFPGAPPYQAVPQQAVAAA